MAWKCHRGAMTVHRGLNKELRVIPEHGSVQETPLTHSRPDAASGSAMPRPGFRHRHRGSRAPSLTGKSQWTKQGRKDSTAGRALAFHAAGPGSSSSIP